MESMAPNWLTRLASKLRLVRARPTAAHRELDDLLSEVLGGGVVRTSGLDEHGRFVAVVEISSAEHVGEPPGDSTADIRSACGDGQPLEREVKR